MTRSLIALALVMLAGGGARAEERIDGGQVHQGVALNLHLSTRLVDFGVNPGAPGGQTIRFGGVQGGIFLGYKIGRVIAGLGFDIARLASGFSSPGTPEQSTADTDILFSPGLRIALVRSPDQRVELFGEFDLGFGHRFHEPSPQGGTQTSTSNFRFQYIVGPGVRYWPHPHFALEFLAALTGDFEFDSSTTAGVTNNSSSGVTSILAQIGGVGVF
jgi:hypothetical protein